MTVSFTALENESGIEIADPIERRQYRFKTPNPVTPNAAPDDEFSVPVDAAVTIRTDRIDLPTVVVAMVRDRTWEPIVQAEHFTYHELAHDSYTIELCAPIKLYLQFDAGVTVRSDAKRMTFEFDRTVDVVIGARSYHKHPAGTITTTADPEAVMTAVSYLGSALKTTTAERSYPTLRGHPPIIQLGDELDVPSGIELPDTGVQIEIPPEYHYIYIVAPLAYYLGAELTPGPAARIVTDTGFEHLLETASGFENEVEQVLKQVFFFDCLTRTEGFYKIDLRERREVEAMVDLDFADLYELSIPEQLEAYLAVQFSAIQEYLPTWKLTTHVAPTPENVEILPFVVNDLAVIRSPRSQPISASEVQTAAVDEFMRDGDFARSASEAAPSIPSLVQPEKTGSLEQAWIGDSTPLGASKVTAEAFKNKLNRVPADGDIDITVICNDPKMAREHDAVSEVYGSRDDLPFDVELHRELTVDELAEVLRSKTDFLHYIGHIDDEGFECVDGMLDASTLDHVGVDAFLLNACRSYQQGMHLIEAGSIGGVVTLDDVVDSGAVKIGCTMARLLNRGFPLRAALNIARNQSIVGGQYIVVGDGNVDIAQSEGGNPTVCEIETTGESDTLTLKLRTYPTSSHGLGGTTTTGLFGNTEHFIASGTLSTFEVSKEELFQVFDIENVPVKIDNNFTWSADIDMDDI